MHDAPRGMRGFPGNRGIALEVAIERNTVMEEVVDTCAGFARQSERYRLIDQARADRDRIGGMCLGTVAFGDRGCDGPLRPCPRSALRPCRRGALAQWRRRNHSD